MTRYPNSSVVCVTTSLDEAIYEMHADQAPRCECVHCEAHRALCAENEDLQELLGNRAWRQLESEAS